MSGSCTGFEDDAYGVLVAFVQEGYESQLLDSDGSMIPLALMNQLHDIERRASHRTVEPSR